MSYRILWAPNAEEELAVILQSSVRFAIYLSSIVRTIEGSLIASPLTFGESREGEMRVAINPPLAIDFEVMKDVRTVVVHKIWRTD